MTSDIYGNMLNLIEKMFFCEQCKKYRNFLPVRKSSANGQFPQILEWFAQKSAETLRRRKISTLGNQKKFQHFKQWKLRLLLFTYVFYSAQVWLFQWNMSDMILLRFCLLPELQRTVQFWNFHHHMSFYDSWHLFAVIRVVEYAVCRYSIFP